MDDQNGEGEPKGISVTRKTHLLQSITLRENQDGEVKMSAEADVSLCLELYWLEIALDHLLEARSARERFRENENADGGSGVKDVESEFKAGMQSVVAAVTAIDALYARVKERAPFSNSPGDGAARYAQIAEVMKQRLEITQEDFERIREHLEELYDFRGKAVHPPADHRKPVRHPDLPMNVERRLVRFGYQNAKPILSNAFSLIGQFVCVPKEEYEDLVEYFDAIKPRVSELLDRWEQHFGSPFDREAFDI